MSEKEQEAQQTATKTVTSFSEFDLAPDVHRTLEKMGFTTPTPIQAKVIGPILEGRDVVGKAETGTGKTVGFGAPLVGKIDTERVSVQALVLAPTRELAQQVAGVFDELGAARGLGVALVVGGVHASEQIEKLRSGCQVVVGTPGRVLEFLRDRILSLAWAETVVLDEADRMLDMGFIDDVTAILDKTPPERQTLLFSATVPPEIQRILDRYMRDPLTASTSSGISTVKEIEQKYIEVEFRNKFRELRKILDAYPDDTAIVFTNTRRQAIDVDRMLWGHGYSAGALHGEQEQDVRFRILEAFRRGDIRVLVATDVASRGLDIEKVSRVINYEVPDDAESYVHRIGRTGRASHTGIAITLVSSKEWRQWQAIAREDRLKIEREGPERLRKRGDARGAGREGGGRDPRRGRGGRGRSRRGATSREPAGGRARDESGEGEVTGRRQEGGGGRRRRTRKRRPETPDEGSKGGDEGAGDRSSSSRRGGRSQGERSGAQRRGRRKSPPVEFTPEEKELLRRKPRERPEKKKLENALEENFIKRDYFDVKGSEGEPPSEKVQSPSSKKDRAADSEEGERPRRRRRRRRPKKNQ